MQEPSQKTEKTPEEEIRELEWLLAEKRKTMEEKGIEKEPKEVFREVFKEYVGAKKPLLPPPAVQLPAAVSDEQKRQADELKQKERHEQLEHLIGISFEKGLLDAVTLAENMTPWLLDELHDRLVDEYYQKLVQSQKLKEF
ncbi:MAG: hypothetical protein A3G49_00065 [Candidatus Sungbacteria bacterium RIFCSPLOWO2_12_FULL_41_11]|uniref:Uncharacterized protein n=1 Tax=Candidatus Sungbacteria bacterium RIFCSPLOWO2_12_FULL_41_11 TaxID=1802286 RepID=A0A1G2LM08_9BACT|nr:MAG: hypothetical protein UV01_C0005G0022 [Parcubacteria group bacterium GW2011_GWA2_42_14]OHA12656.1 MAG: hypothetical protein A3G49_00065 [Candidatus Sungbacteria bacterium RIFCSPLOWO2_12_FULL_41_11]